MSIVFITIPGESKKVFAHSLHRQTQGVELIIIQKPKIQTPIARFKRLYKNTGLIRLPKEMAYAVLLRYSKKVRSALEYFRESPHQPTEPLDYPARVLEVESVNSDEVYEALKNISPKLLVIWGTAIIKPHIVSTAQHAINLHMGFCPYYRGAIANQMAVLNGDISRIGATIHYADEKVDAGNILRQIRADHSKPPRELFRDLNDRAHSQFLKIAVKLYNDKHIPKTPQDIGRGQNCLMKQWTPEKRYKVGKYLVNWEKALTKAPAIVHHVVMLSVISNTFMPELSFI